MSLHPCFRRRWLLQVCLGKTFPQKHAFVDISVFVCLRKQRPRFAQGQPKKEFHRTTKAIAQMNADWKVEKAQYAESKMWQDCSLTAVQRKTAFLEQSWWPGSMLWCSFPWVHNNLCAARKGVVGVHGAGPKGYQQVFIHTSHSGAVTLDALLNQQPRFAQGQPKKEFQRTTKAIAQMNADWKVKAERAEFNVPTWANIAVCQLCRERQPFWNSHDGIWHVWINATVFVPMAQAPCKVGAKELSYNSLNLIYEFTSLFSPKVTVAGLPRKNFPTEACLCGQQCFSVFAQATAKIRPRPAQERIS